MLMKIIIKNNPCFNRKSHQKMTVKINEWKKIILISFFHVHSKF